MAQSISNFERVLKEVWTQELIEGFLNQRSLLFHEWSLAPRPDVVLAMRFWGAW